MLIGLKQDPNFYWFYICAPYWGTLQDIIHDIVYYMFIPYFLFRTPVYLSNLYATNLAVWGNSQQLNAFTACCGILAILQYNRLGKTVMHTYTHREKYTHKTCNSRLCKKTTKFSSYKMKNTLYYTLSWKISS